MTILLCQEVTVLAASNDFACRVWTWSNQRLQVRGFQIQRNLYILYDWRTFPLNFISLSIAASSPNFRWTANRDYNSSSWSVDVTLGCCRLQLSATCSCCCSLTISECSISVSRSIDLLQLPTLAVPSWMVGCAQRHNLCRLDITSPGNCWSLLINHNTEFIIKWKISAVCMKWSSEPTGGQTDRRAGGLPVSSMSTN